MDTNANTGRTVAEVSTTVADTDAVRPRETTFSVGYKKNEETELFDSSMSVGLKFDKKGINNNSGTYFETKAIVGDLGLTNGAQKPKIQLDGKFNASSGFQTIGSTSKQKCNPEYWI